MKQLQDAMQNFCDGLNRIVDRQVEERLSAIVQTFHPNGVVKRHFTGPPKDTSYAKRLCPVLGCKKPAAPAYNMVCAEHKDVDPKKIARYRKGKRFADANDLKFEDVMKNWERYRRKIAELYN